MEGATPVFRKVVPNTPIVVGTASPTEAVRSARWRDAPQQQRARVSAANMEGEPDAVRRGARRRLDMMDCAAIMGASRSASRTAAPQKQGNTVYAASMGATRDASGTVARCRLKERVDYAEHATR